MRQVIKWLVFIFITLKSGAVIASSQVLAIHSYHPDFFWTKSLVQGIESGTQSYDITVEHTYLDTKRVQTKGYLEDLKSLYKTRLTNHHYDAILTTDNAALWLVSQLADEIGDTPVIFSGLNTSTYSLLHAAPNLTGVNEAIDISDNIALIKEAQPDVERVWIVLDDSFSSKQYWASIQEQLATDKDEHVEIKRLHSLLFDELIDQVAALEAGDVVLFVSYFKDASGAFMEHGDLLTALTSKAVVPIYGASSFMLPYGVVGGVMVDGQHHGSVQARLLRESLSASMPPVVMDANRTMFGFDAAKKWGVNLSAHPNAVVTDRPPSFWDANRTAVNSSLAVLAVSVFIIAVLGKHLSKQKLSERALAQSRALFKGVFDQSHQYIALLDYHGRVVSANGAFQRLFPDAMAKSALPLWRWSDWLSADRLKLHVESLIEGQTSRFEACLLSDQQREIILDVAIKALPEHSHADAQILFEARDISQRKLAEQKLQRSEVEYRMLYEQQPVMLLTIDQQSRIQSVNQCASELLGFSKRHILGHKVTDFYADNSPPPRSLLTSKKKDSTDILRREIRYRTSDGQVRWIRESVRSTQVQSQLLLVGEDITENRRMEQQLRYQAQHDFLTGLRNRNYFEMCLADALRETNEMGLVHAMFYIDLDQFRVINDTVGHEAGDEALKQTAQVLKSLLPESATLARLGGDEFAVICYNCNEQAALKQGYQILEALSGLDFYWNNARLALGCSVGVRMLDHTAGSPQQVHAQADTACYAAKHDGRSRVHFYRPEDQELRRHEREMAFVNKIHQALAEDRIEVYAQPIVKVSPLAEEKLYFEVLVRMREPSGEYVAPGQFISAAERYNMAHLIDKRVIEKTLGWFASNPKYIDDIAMVSVNLSGRSMSDQGFIHFLINALRSSIIPSDRVCLEITETAAIGNLTDAIDLFTQLKKLGCTIALDDFGSGLSSFGYLKRLPVDIIKIDGQFVRDIAEDETDFVMVRAIHELATQMGKKTVAEFVENDAILQRLKTLGVDYAQGYHFSMPKPMDQLVMETSIRSTEEHTPAARHV
ncbi:EAL domain-containing protein [Enterovibrio sp. ZSDZ35]|uniref:EAL domain-containing protein n=1 Tax=Enterovibrio qingdaonensis TaxID=2899818 RepID=A0ABT5QRK7_9GAMM|nr:ABC transporter substrate binding protein [Enterovibrio sp. ZSDZ35]MDD1783529.1 EAL domain-containing protein [Enterovibrio sp. ZSDZ35]